LKNIFLVGFDADFSMIFFWHSSALLVTFAVLAWS